MNIKTTITTGLQYGKAVKVVFYIASKTERNKNEEISVFNGSRNVCRKWV